MKRDFTKKIEPANLEESGLKGKTIEVGKPDISEPAIAAIISCQAIQEDKDSFDDRKRAYRNMGLLLTYSLKLDGEQRDIDERLMGLRKYPTHLWCSKGSGFGMLKQVLDQMEEYNGGIDNVSKLIVGKKCKIQTKVIDAFGEEFPKIVPIEFLKEGKGTEIKEPDTDMVV